MIKVESGCVGCPPEMGCLYEGCPYYRELHFYCDECDHEDDLYEFEGRQLCADCIATILEERDDCIIDIDTLVKCYLYEDEWLYLDELLDILPKITEKDFEDYGF